MTDLAPIIDDRERYKAFSKLMTGYTPSSDFDKRLLLGVYKSSSKLEMERICIGSGRDENG